MKILVVTQYYWPESFQITDECEDLVSRGHEVTVLTGLPNYPSGKIDADYTRGRNRIQQHNGVRIIRVPLIARGHNPLRLALNYYSFAWSSTKAVEKLNGDFDVVYVPEISPVTMVRAAARYKKMHHTPLLVYCLDLWPESLKNVLGNHGKSIINHYKKVSGELYRSADLVPVQSPAFSDYLFDTHSISRDKTPYLPQFANTDYLSMNLCSDHDGVNFLIAGNMGRAQDIPVILRAVEKMKIKKGFRVHFIGNGSCFEATSRYVEDHGLTDRIELHGRRPYEEMPDWYRLADACILALNGDTWVGTTVPTRLQGYMAAGKPVIAAARGGIDGVINASGCGICVPAGDSDSLALALDAFVDNPALLDGCGEAGRNYFRENFTKEQHMDELEKMLLGLCGKEN